jgi:hypothetical protein
MLKSVTETIEEDRQDGRRSREFRVFCAAQRAITMLSMASIPMATIRGAPVKDI